MSPSHLINNPVSDSCVASEVMKDVSYPVILKRNEEKSKGSAELVSAKGPRALENTERSSVRNLVPNMTAPALMEMWIVIVPQDVYVDKTQTEWSALVSCLGLV